MATIKDVARRANVSTASVSRVLTGHPATSPEMRARVLKAADELNFRPNRVARSLRTTGTGTIGLVVSDLLNPFFTELARAVEDAARAAGYSVIVGNADEDPEQQDHYVRILLGRQVDGLIVVPTTETSPLLREAAARGRKLVLVDRPAPAVHAPIVRADGGAAISELVRHLVATGRRDLAMVTGPEHAGTARERLDQFRTAVENAGLLLRSENVVHGDFQADSGREAMGRLLDAPSRPDAVFIANGTMALGALHAMAEHADAPAIPTDLAVAVFDDTPWFALHRPSLTAISQPTTLLGQRAMAMLLAALGEEDVSDEHYECELVLRDSTGPS